MGDLQADRLKIEKHPEGDCGHKADRCSGVVSFIDMLVLSQVSLARCCLSSSCKLPLRAN